MAFTKANLMTAAFNWGRNWATIKKTEVSESDVAASMAASFSFDSWKVEYRDEFWRGFNEGPHDVVSIQPQGYDFKR